LAYVLRNNNFISLVAIGAAVDLVTDASPAISRALDLSAINGLPVSGDDQEFLIGTAITKEDDVNLYNANFLIDPAVTTGFDFGRTIKAANTTLAAAVTLGNSTVTVASGTGIVKGQLMVLISDRIWPFDAPRNLNAGEIGIVESVSGAVVTLETPVNDTYAVTETVTADFYVPSTNIFIDNVKIRRAAPIEKGGMAIRRALWPVLNNIEVENCGSAGIGLSVCFEAVIDKLFLKNCHILGGSTGYGIQDNSSQGTLITNLTAYGCRRAVDFSGTIPSRYGILDNFYVEGFAGTGSCVGSHGTNYGAAFRNGTCKGSIAGVQIRSPGCEIDNVKFIANGTRAIILSFTMDCTIKNNKQDPQIYRETTGSLAGTPTRFLEI